MIPQRVQLAGFLSYKEPREIAFTGAPIWMLTGANGSGKSAIFDAVTYALYGYHRGGSQNADELINKPSTGLAVEFDFLLDNQLFRIKRTLKRTKAGSAAGTQQVFTLTGDDWEAVPDTNKKVDFDRWIAAKVGLSYDIFTSSVLLLQGKAEKLLDAKPTARAEVLAGIVDLERYQKLHEAANTKKLDFKSKAETVQKQIGGVPVVDDADLAAALARIADAERLRAEARERLKVSQELVETGKRHAEAKQRVEVARLRLIRSEQLLADAAKIQIAFQRFTELKQVLPAVEIVVTTRAKSTEATKKTAKLNAEKTETIQSKSAAEGELDDRKKQRALDKKQLADREAELTALNAQLRRLSAQLQTVRQVEDEETKRQQFTEELAKLPKNPDDDLQKSRSEIDRLTTLDRVLPILERLQTERHELEVAQAAIDEQTKKRAEHKKAGEVARKEFDRAKLDLDAARAERGAADTVVGVAQSNHSQTKTALAEFRTVEGSKICSACGQPLTPAHFAEELQRRNEALKQAAAAQMRAIVAAEAVAKQEAAAEVVNTERAAALEKRREDYKTADAALGTAKRDAERLTKSLDLRYAEMPSPYRERIATTPPMDWSHTNYPERDELAVLRRELQGNLDLARRQATAAEQSLQKIRDLRTRLDAATQSRDRLKTNLPSTDVIALRQDYATAQSRETALANQIKAGKQAIEQSDRAVDKLGTEVADAAQKLTELAGKRNAEALAIKHCAETIAKWLQQLPEAWRERTESAGLQHYSEWKSELGRLEADETESRHRQLEQSRHGLDSFRGELARLESEAAAFPAESQGAAHELEANAVVAERAFDHSDGVLQSAQKEKLKLDGYKESRVEFGKQFVEYDGMFHRYKLLAELLGRDRLQRHLVRRAERQIVDYGNAVLDRLSNGQLYLKLAGDGDGTEKALELECYNRATGEEPIHVVFLSGSQKFRVAVSLALAIGQCASRQHRPIESVIIDEGFGSLDRIGRQVMIQELQNLRGQLKCILLVSHQEEFAEAFPDGYRFELVDGATAVERFHR